MAKKEKQKIIIAKVPRPAKFDLTLERKGEAEKVIAALESLRTNAGWMFLSQMTEKNIEYLEKQIISKIGVGEDGKPCTLKDTDIDILREKHAILSEIINTPEKYLRNLKRKPSELPNLDPYHQ